MVTVSITLQMIDPSGKKQNQSVSIWSNR